MENNISQKITHSAVQNLDWQVMDVLLCLLKFEYKVSLNYFCHMMYRIFMH